MKLTAIILTSALLAAPAQASILNLDFYQRGPVNSMCEGSFASTCNQMKYAQGTEHGLTPTYFRRYFERIGYWHGYDVYEQTGGSFGTFGANWVNILLGSAPIPDPEPEIPWTPETPSTVVPLPPALFLLLGGLAGLGLLGRRKRA